MIKKIAATQAIAMALATTMFVALPLADAHAQGEQSTIEQILLRRGGWAKSESER